MTYDEFSGGQPVKPLGMSAEEFGGGQPLTTDSNAALLGVTTSAHDRLMQAQQASEQAQKTSDYANSAEGLTSETLKGLPKASAAGTGKLIGSVVATIPDLIKGMFGKGGTLGLNNSVFDAKPIELPALKNAGITTYQEDQQGITSDVFEGKTSPLMGTAQTVGPVLAGAGDTLGAVGLAEKGIAAVPKLAKAVIEATPSVVKGAGNVVRGTGKVLSEIRHPIRGAEGNKVIKTIEHLKATDDTMTKSERINAANQGRLEQTRLGKTEFAPSKTEERAGTLLSGKTTGNPVKDLNLVKNEISNRGAEVEQYLAKNSKAISNKEDYDAFDKVRQEASKYLTDPEMKAYDEQVKMFSKQLQGRGGYNTENYYKALKDYEANVADKLPRGKEALIDPTGIANAKIRAASDVRSVVRDMIGSKHNEFKDKMFDLASLYDVKGTLLTKADKLEGNVFTRFAKKHPFITGGIGTLGVEEAIRKIAK
jgi:hypothetical protein